jgi:hypothetical protein
VVTGRPIGGGGRRGTTTGAPLVRRQVKADRSASGRGSGRRPQCCREGVAVGGVGGGPMQAQNFVR